MKMEPSHIKNVSTSKGHLNDLLVYGLFEVNYYKGSLCGGLYFWIKENILQGKMEIFCNCNFLIIFNFLLKLQINSRYKYECADNRVKKHSTDHFRQLLNGYLI